MMVRCKHTVSADSSNLKASTATKWPPVSTAGSPGDPSPTRGHAREPPAGEGRQPQQRIEDGTDQGEGERQQRQAAAGRMDEDHGDAMAGEQP